MRWFIGRRLHTLLDKTTLTPDQTESSSTMMTEHHHQCDVAIIGTGPVGLFAVFEFGMPGMETFARTPNLSLRGAKRRSNPCRQVVPVGRHGLPRLRLAMTTLRFGAKISNRDIARCHGGGHACTIPPAHTIGRCETGFIGWHGDG